MNTIDALEITMGIVALGGLWYLTRILSRVVLVLDGVVSAQADFAHVVERMGEMMDSVWESQGTRKTVLEAQERHAEEHKAMLAKLDDIRSELKR